MIIESDIAKLFISIGIILLIPVCIFGILNIIGLWKILEKAGKPGWAALIPFYGQYLLCEVVGVTPWWIAVVLLSGFVPYLGDKITFAAAIYFSVLLNFGLARAFGKDDSFAFGLFFLSPIFYLILGMNKDTYLGPNPINDIIFDNLLKKENNNQDSRNENIRTDNNTKSNYCTNCGNRIENGAQFCTVCGKKIK